MASMNATSKLGGGPVSLEWRDSEDEEEEE